MLSLQIFSALFLQENLPRLRRQEEEYKKKTYTILRVLQQFI